MLTQDRYRCNKYGNVAVSYVRHLGKPLQSSLDRNDDVLVLRRKLHMHVLKLKPLISGAAAGAVSLGLSFAVLAGPPTLRSMPAGTTAATPKTAATNQKAATTTHTTGQPRQTCGSPTAPETPGHAASSPGSPFDPNGNAGTHYAGSQPQNSKNPTSVAQYDVACSHQK